MANFVPMNCALLISALACNWFSNLVEFDRNLFTTLNSASFSLGDILMPIITHPLTGVPIYMLMLWLLYRKFFHEANSAELQTKHKWMLLIAAVAAVVATFGLCDWGSAEFFKYTICRLRPSHDPELAGSIRLLEDAGGLYGFVSSHAANLFGLALITSLLVRKRWYTIFIFIWALLVGYSRIYVGKHFPGDVICGALYGMVAAMLVWYIHKMAVGRFGKAIY